MNRFTELVQFDVCPNDPYQPNSTPIYQTATFAQEDIGSFAQYDYSRSGNPTRSVLEGQLAKLEQGQRAFVFNSGMAALTVIIGLLKQGDHIIAGDDLYGGTHRLLSQRLNARGITYTLVDTTQIACVEQALQKNTRLLLIETPSNPLQKITDIQALAKLAHQAGALLAVDNTFLSPWLQKPLLLGADIVVHSATKHLSGHSDVTAGAIIVNCPSLANSIAFIQNAEGSALTPFESWLLLRGIKTLGLRIERQQSVALKLVSYLCQHPAIKKVYYSSLKAHTGHALHAAQAKGPGTVISFETGSTELSKQWIRYLTLFKISVSFGSLTSLISMPCYMSHASKPEGQRNIPLDLIRLSIGIEGPEDLVQDLEQAYQLAIK